MAGDPAAGTGRAPIVVAMHTTPAVEAQGLRASYGAVEVVHGVDLTAEHGRLVALLGTNGAGKTTTLETLEGHRAPDGGTVRVLGHDPHRERALVRPRVGILLQHSGFAADLTAAETVALWARLRRRATDPSAALERVDLAHRRDVAVSALSGGERRRLDLALAVLTDPEVLFLDEPTTGLDPESRRRTWDVVRELLACGTAVVLTTHYLEEAEVLADRLAIMNEGRVVVAGTTDEVLADAPARLAFTLPPGVAPPRGLVIPAPRDGRVELRTWSLQRDLSALLAWADAHDVRLERLEARHASLDDVFRTVATPALHALKEPA